MVRIWLCLGAVLRTVGTPLVVLGSWSVVAEAATVLAPHRAIYDMTMEPGNGATAVSSVDGRLVYELTGSACEGFTQNMRFVTRMTTQQGQTTLNDLRSTTWEDAIGSKLRFDSHSLKDAKAAEAAMGEASRSTGNGPATIVLTKPEATTFKSPSTVSFPVQHSLQLIEAARAGLSRVQANLYDGSEKGDKIYETVASIGPRIKPEAMIGADKVTAKGAILDTLAGWPVSISYFEPGSEKIDAVPIYEMSFWFFENGVSRKLKIDFGEFAIAGDLKDITFLPAKDCAAGREKAK